MPTDLIYLILSFLFTSFFYRQVLIRKDLINIYDHPSDRKIHNKKMLKVGGIGIVFSFLFILCVYRLLNGEYIFQVRQDEVYVALSVIFLIIGGFVDDLIGLNAPRKLFFQLISIGILLYSNFFIILFDSYLLNIVASTILYIFIINSMNLIDGVDGLSSGIFIIFSSVIFFIFTLHGALDSKYYVVVLIFMGTIISFFSINFPPAKIFLGDSGSQLLGWVMAISIIHLSSFYEQIYQKIYLLSFLSIPFYDVFCVIFRRFTSHKGSIAEKIIRIVKSDQNHIHHIMLKNNFSNSYTLFLLLLTFLVLTSVSLLPILFDGYYISVFLLILFIYIYIRSILEKKAN